MQSNSVDIIVSIGKESRLRRRAGFVVGWEEVGGEDGHAGNRWWFLFLWRLGY